MQETELSVIIPVYNAERTLNRCLASVLGSNVSSMEVICVNDGSTDGSEKLLKEWETRDSRIRLLSQENKGVSSARNAALKIVSGQYTVFVDADDEVTPDYFSNLLQSARVNNAELVVCGFRHQNKESIKTMKPGVISPITPEKVKALPMGVCSHLYKTSILQKGGSIVEFPSGVRYGEDSAYHYSLYPHINTIAISSETGYIIFPSENSATCRASNLVGDLVDALLWLHGQYRKSADLSTAKRYLAQFAAHTMRRIHALSPYKELKKHSHRLRDAMMVCEFSEDDILTIDTKYARRLLNIMRGGRGITPSYYFKALKSFLRKRK